MTKSQDNMYKKYNLLDYITSNYILYKKAREINIFTTRIGEIEYEYITGNFTAYIYAYRLLRSDL